MEDSSRPPGGARWMLVPLLVTVVVAAVGVLFDRVLLREGVTRNDLLVLSNSLTGIVCGALFWQARRREQERRDFVNRRLKTISGMNHHIRNALQVIAFHVARENAEDKTVKQAKDAVDRIQWALREVLPETLDKPAQSPPEAMGVRGERR
jgi:hypothetical protein